MTNVTRHMLSRTGDRNGFLLASLCLLLRRPSVLLLAFSTGHGVGTCDFASANLAGLALNMARGYSYNRGRNVKIE